MNPIHSLPGPLLAALFLLGACSSEAPDSGRSYATGPDMFPGRNCLSCHAEGFGDPAPTWSAAGTVFAMRDSDQGVEGAVITLSDKNGTTESATTTSSGNFHFPEGLEPPFKVELEYQGERIEMPIDAPAGSCNACHQHPSPLAGAPGRIFPNQGRSDWQPSQTM